MHKTRIAILIHSLILAIVVNAQRMTTNTRASDFVIISGFVVDNDNGKPIEFSTLLLQENNLWAVSDDKGYFSIRNVPKGRTTLTVQCLGFEKRTLTMDLSRDVTNLRLRLKPENLKLSEVTVTAKRKTDEATTSYTIDRQTLDQQQILNVSDIQTLLPGGKTVNPSLLNDNRMALRSGEQEKGNASFGTAIEVDGMRLDNNAAAGETMGASSRTISTSNIESIEVVAGIPSVEYGDLSNGIVKVNTRKGKSPFIVEGKINQHTRQIALNKGFDLGKNFGVLNTSIEHARSFQNPVSPYTAYHRNIVSLSYLNIFLKDTTPLTLNASLTGNIGGYNSEADPDRNLDDYSKARDNAFRGNVDLQWLLNKSWITNLRVSGSFSYADKKSETYSNTNSATTLPYIHTTEEGYHMAQDVSSLPSTLSPIQAPIILSPTGYWYTRSYNDSKPLSFALKVKADWSRRFGRVANRLTVGSQYQVSRNYGRGTYYEEPRLTPTWREYRYDQLPAMHNLAFYAEEKIVVPTTKRSTFELTAGLRDDITMISGSDYGTVNSLSPRFNSRYIFVKNQRKHFVSDLEVHAGWGKSVKLPSQQVLFPRPTYTDREAFTSSSDARNVTYSAYHTMPAKALYNPDLSWQYTHQIDLGAEAKIKGTRIALSAFYHRTNRTYMAMTNYTPFAYNYTPVSSVEKVVGNLKSNYNIVLPAENRRFDINQQTGLVTMNDATGTASPYLPSHLDYTTRKTYATRQTFTNAESPIHRYGLEWIIDFAQIKPLLTTIRLDGKYSYYKGTDEVLYADIPLGVNSYQTNGQLYQYVGYFRGSDVTSTGYSANAAISNGALSKQLNLNATFTTHIPKIRMIVALRIESTLYTWRHSLSEFESGSRGYMLDDTNGYVGQPYDGSSDKFVVVYPEYYSTWEQPNVRRPFAEDFLNARQQMQQDPTDKEAAALYSDLSKLVVRTNYAYTMNANRLSAYYAANLSVTKEIGDHVSVSFYANNFFRNMAKVHSSQTDLETSLFSSSYIPGFYYGLSMRIKM